MTTRKQIYLTLAVLTIAVITSATLLFPTKNDDSKIIGVVQFVHQPLLDETYRGLISRLTELGLNNGSSIRVETFVADKNPQLCSQVARQLVSRGAPIIVAIATPAAQAVYSVSGETPVVFAAITDPVAAKLVNSIDRPGGNATGTSNRWPFELQISLVKQLIPAAKTIGAVWNPGETNSDAAMKYIRPIAAKAGLSIVEVPVSSTGDVAPAAQSIASTIDAFLMIPDNTALAATAALVEVARGTNKPLIGGDKDTVRQGGLATYGYNYFQLGEVTADMVKAILIDGVSPAVMPVRFPPESELVVNLVASKHFGIPIPPALLESSSERVE